MHHLNGLLRGVGMLTRFHCMGCSVPWLEGLFCPLHMASPQPALGPYLQPHHCLEVHLGSQTSPLELR